MKKFLFTLIVFVSLSITANAQNANSFSGSEFDGTPPVLKQCKDITNPEVLKKCLSSNVDKNIKSKIKFEKILPELNAGINRLYIDFTVSANKEITGVVMNFPNGKLSEYVEKALQKLKFEKPATTSNGEAVNVRYTVPLIVKNDDFLNKPTPVYEESELRLTNIRLDELNWAPRYFFKETKMMGRPDKDMENSFTSTKNRYISSIYNRVNIYKIGGYLDEGLNIFNIKFTIDTNGELNNFKSDIESENLNKYLKSVLENLPKLTTAVRNKEQTSADYELVLAYSLKTKK